MDMHGQGLLVTGGSRGLGLAIVQHYLERGCRVATFARKGTPEVTELEQRYGADFLFAAIDALENAKVEAFVERIHQTFGGLHGLVNNAAIGQDHLLAHMSADMVDQIIAVNLTSPIRLTRAVVRKMLLSQTGGRIVNVTSICGSRGYAGLTVYSATKGGLDAFTRSLARELGGRNILVNALAPGFFESQMSSVLAANQLATIKRRTPTERLCTDQNLLPLLDLFLFEDSNMTGQTVWVDGGSTI